MSEANAGNTTILDRGEPDDYVRLSAHPRARRSIAKAKALGGLIGFLLGFWLASRSGLPAWDVGVRALAGGVAGYVLLWLGSVTVWRQYALAEYRAAAKRRRRLILEHNERVLQMRAERAEALKAATEAGS
jgi:hypothetical protein